jgi:hypothetical protein
MARNTMPAEASPLSPVHVIPEAGVYTVQDAKRIFNLRDSTIRREVREGRLRIAKRAGRYFLLGEWLLQWLRAGEVKRRRPGLAPVGAGEGEAQSG